MLWSFLQPLGMMLVMTLVSGVVNASTRPNWHIYVLSGLLAWNFFSASVVSGAGSVIANAALVKKIYFPRAVLPLSTVLSSLVNFLLALPVFLVVALVSGHPPDRCAVAAAGGDCDPDRFQRSASRFSWQR